MPIIEITREEGRGPAARQIPGSSWDEDQGVWSFDPAANDHAAAIAAALFPELRDRLREWLPDEASSDTRGKPVLGQTEAVAGRPGEPTTEPTNQGSSNQPPP